MPTLKLKNKKKIKPVMEGTPIQTNAAIIAKYKRRLKKITKMMTDETTRKVVSFFKKGFVDDYFVKQEDLNAEQKVSVMDEKSPSSQVRIMTNKLRRKFEKLLKEKGTKYAESMLAEINVDSKSRVAVSLQKLSGLNQDVKLSSPMISEELKASLSWNVSLISDLPAKYFNDVSGVVTRAISQGGAFDIEQEMLKYDGMTDKRAGRIAEDQTRKAFNNLNQQRFTSAGLNKFEWNHSSAGQTPRPLHVELDGQIFSFDDLPVIDDSTGERGIPGQLPNCRCFMTPVLEFDTEEEEEIEDAT